MATNYGKHYKTKKTQTDQSVQADPNQVQNNAGGFSFAVDKWGRLQRFLILGSEGGSYYANERELTIENAKCVEDCIKEDGIRVVRTIVEISDAGRAPKNDPALFALAICSASDDVKTRKAAINALPKVARIGTHLFHYAEYVNGLRGWGKLLRSGVAKWYNNMPTDKLALQAVKYQQRDGWSHRDLLRLSHPKSEDAARDDIYKWMVGKAENVSDETSVINGFEQAKIAENAKEIVELINDFNLPREAIPTNFLNDVTVWDALLTSMPMTAMIRNLGKMSQVGLLTAGSDAARTIVERLKDEEVIRKSRVHPLAVITAMKTYQMGRGMRGSLSWTPVPRVIDALDGAFYTAFGNVEPTGKRMVLGLDVSGSMVCSISGSPLTAYEGSAVMALVTANVESDYEIMAFGDKFVPCDITPKMRLDDALRKMRSISFGGTDCALPMMWALGYNNSGGGGWGRSSNYTKVGPVVKADAFIVYTDNETWYGSIHPHEALKRYRNQTGIPAKLAVVGMVSNGFTIADPNDAGTLDVVGFDTATPNIISDFIKG